MRQSVARVLEPLPGVSRAVYRAGGFEKSTAVVFSVIVAHARRHGPHAVVVTVRKGFILMRVGRDNLGISSPAPCCWQTTLLIRGSTFLFLPRDTLKFALEQCTMLAIPILAKGTLSIFFAARYVDVCT